MDFMANYNGLMWFAAQWRAARSHLDSPVLLVGDVEGIMPFAGSSSSSTFDTFKA